MTYQPHLMEIDPDEQLSKEDKAKKAEYRQRLAEKLNDPELRQIEGFPIGDDEEVLELSDPPYYTACPNPFIEELLDKWQEQRNIIRKWVGLDEDERGENFLRKPLSVDVSAGKYHPIYKLHPYPTKVPHQAVMRYILHYTEPGDLVFDGFCGTGMTGVAANLCGDKAEVQKLGFRVDDDNSIKLENGKIISYLGERFCILNDLSTSAAFISKNLNSNTNIKRLEVLARKVFEVIESEIQWMYLTLHNPTKEVINSATEKITQNKKNRNDDFSFGIVNYTAWSDVFICPHCSNEIVFWDAAVDEENGKVASNFSCDHCSNEISKKELERAWDNKFDKALGKSIKEAKRVPVIINYSIGKKRYKKKPDKFDFELLKIIESMDIPYWYPTSRMPNGDESRRNDDIGITNVHQFYSKRNIYTLAYINSLTKNNPDFLFAITRVALQITHLYRLTYQNGTWGAGGGPLSGTLYIPSLIKELNIFIRLKAGIKNQIKNRNYLLEQKTTVTTNQSSTDLKQINSNSIDYIFVDPPFGGNLMYSELNFIWESWINVFTNNSHEVIENKSQGKGVFEFQRLMTSCFEEFYRILKPEKWITIEFHNSKNSIWNSIQEALKVSGFIIADVRTLDKKKKTFKQVVSSGAVDQDLIISAYKPSLDFENKFLISGGTEESVWEFVRQHLEHLPIVVTSQKVIETIAERTTFLLFDRMVAYHIQVGKTIPISASEFYKGLKERFPERDGMIFLPDQVTHYDREKMSIKNVAQLTLFVTDEKSTIQWLRQTLDENSNGEPHSYQELQPKFLKQLQQARHEELPELVEILEQNFLQNEQGRWYVPDPNKASDLEKIRNKALLREFNQYLEDNKKLKQFRTEAIRAGFADAWQRKDYKIIVKVAERLPEVIIQEDPDLLMYYDNASLRVN